MANNPYADNFQSGGYFYNAIRQDIAIVEGDTCSFSFQIQGLEGQEPSSIKLTAKKSIEDEDAIFVCELGEEIEREFYDSVNDILTYVVRISPAATSGLSQGRYYYDLTAYVNSDVLTLMKGRLAIDYAVRGEAATYEDGDLIEYPRNDIPVGKKRLYTEQTISDIAEKIDAILVSYDTMNVSEMKTELTAILGDINAVSMAINYMKNNEGGDDIPLSEMANEVLTIDRGFRTRNMIITRTTYEEVS